MTKRSVLLGFIAALVVVGLVAVGSNVQGWRHDLCLGLAIGLGVIAFVTALYQQRVVTTSAALTSGLARPIREGDRSMAVVA